ncbi:Alpha/Beta hydrolase protein [Parachaetomium inaequale]|uniref:Carboxypeptidase n=1 Tax=Parachaetomium inaequale TaxID=2588326 RepID=A0AAN6SNP4_9PEZI|nr:Alpha/Beta hydrolase protein [Parachaetomium inaequale]
MALSLWNLVLLGLLATTARGAETAQHQTVRSFLDPGVSLSYKLTTICETTPGVKSYSGYVNLPANTTEGRPYDIHTFFWFFEARKNADTAPLSLWLQGGPGAPSTPAALGEIGPCFVARNSRDTVRNPWSFHDKVNMLYIDQPVQTGFSYDRLVNGTVDETLLPYDVTPLAPGAPVPELNSTFLLGTFPSQNPMSTANTSSTAALATWHFMQIWLKQFPQYKPSENKISIWSESYGGHYGPTFANFFSKQSQKIADGSIDQTAIPLRLDTVGIINGCIDILTQIPAYPQMAYNNTYGIQVITEAEYNAALNSFPECRRRVEACQSLADAEDPDGLGNVDKVNTACSDAYYYCLGTMSGGVASRGRNLFDITAVMPHSFPPKYAGGFLNSKEVQLELGVPLNISGLSTAVFDAFMSTGDFVLGKNLQLLGNLLDQGVKVALVYGDRDYQCNWYGGEQISLAIQSKFSHKFRHAGYAKIQTNKTYVGGYVRQHGNLSFSRVLDAGHEGIDAAPWYQPETAYQIFNRVMFNKDVATGKISTTKPLAGAYSTCGPSNVLNVTNAVPAHREAECYLWDIFQTCTALQTEQLRNGTAILENFIMIGYQLADGSAHYY